MSLMGQNWRGCRRQWTYSNSWTSVTTTSCTQNMCTIWKTVLSRMRDFLLEQIWFLHTWLLCFEYHFNYYLLRISRVSLDQGRLEDSAFENKGLRADESTLNNVAILGWNWVQKSIYFKQLYIMEWGPHCVDSMLYGYYINTYSFFF